MFYFRGLVAQFKKKSTKDEVYRAEVWRLPGVLSSGGVGRGGCPLLPPLHCDSSRAVQPPSEVSPSPGVWRLIAAQSQIKHMAGLHPQLLPEAE